MTNEVTGASERHDDRGAVGSPVERPVRRPLQGGMTNAELTDAWCKKLPGVVPTERDLTAFALGVEVGREIGRPVVDWKKFEGWPRPTLTCRCGAQYLSHCKYIRHEGAFVDMSERPCPNCGADFGHIKRAEHPPEKWLVRG